MNWNQPSRTEAVLLRVRAPDRHHRVGALARSARDGRNRTGFTGRIAGRALKAGRYRATIRALDEAGNRSRQKRTTFRIVQ